MAIISDDGMGHYTIVPVSLDNSQKGWHTNGRVDPKIVTYQSVEQQYPVRWAGGKMDISHIPDRDWTITPSSGSVSYNAITTPPTIRIPTTIQKTAVTSNPISPRYESDNTPVSGSTVENQILQLTNNERKNNGVNPLVYDSSLAAIARAHSQDMLNNNYFSHINLNGDDPSERASKAGYNIHKSYQVGVAENIGMTEGYVSSSNIAQEFIEMWMNSPGHRSNILNSQYNRLGVGVASRGSKIIATQVFF